ncbi:MAG TPA: helix-turn-helix transcriptional regulator [Solirubrobacterales bacterium]|jgi:transcriptional regulator with XRE-family HTH domain
MLGKRRDPTFANVFGKNLARHREAKGISQEDLGFMADLHRTAVGQLERGERVARSDTLFKLCGSLGIWPSELFEGLSWTPAEYTAGLLYVRDQDDALSSVSSTPSAERPPTGV